MQLRTRPHSFGCSTDVMRRLRGHSEDTSMKALSILPVAVAAMMAFGISTASSQGACQQEFQACMDFCATRSAKTLQDRCFNSCESTNNVCAERVYGKRPFNGTPTTAAAQQRGAGQGRTGQDRERAGPAARAGCRSGTGSAGGEASRRSAARPAAALKSVRLADRSTSRRSPRSFAWRSPAPQPVEKTAARFARRR